MTDALSLAARWWFGVTERSVATMLDMDNSPGATETDLPCAAKVWVGTGGTAREVIGNVLLLPLLLLVLLSQRARAGEVHIGTPFFESSASPASLPWELPMLMNGWTRREAFFSRDSRLRSRRVGLSDCGRNWVEEGGGGAGFVVRGRVVECCDSGEEPMSRYGLECCLNTG